VKTEGINIDEDNDSYFEPYDIDEDAIPGNLNEKGPVEAEK